MVLFVFVFDYRGCTGVCRIKIRVRSSTWRAAARPLLYGVEGGESWKTEEGAMWDVFTYMVTKEHRTLLILAHHKYSLVLHGWDYG